MIDMTSPTNWTRFFILGPIVLFCFHLCVQRRRQREADKLFGQQHGCQPIKSKLPYKWPLALDIFKKQYEALMRGNLLAYQAEYFEHSRVRYTFEVKLLGRIGYFTMDPRNLEVMLQSRFDDWELGNSRDAILPMVGNGIFTQDGHAWKRSREILRRQFIRMPYQDMTLFEAPVEKMLISLRSCEGVVDLQPVFFDFTLATTVSLILGELSTEIKTSDHRMFSDAFNYTSLISAVRMRLADLCWLYNPSKYRKACRLVNNYAMHYVNGALEEMRKIGEGVAEQRHPFAIDLLRELKDPKLVRDQLLNVLIAGRDTTACLMSWACYQLVRHPAALSRLRDEIATFVGNKEPLTRQQINKMTYLRYVLNETNRLYTQIPVNIRLARQTTYLPYGGGPDGESPILIPKGTGVGFSAYHMHRSKEIYGEHANEFRPERWASSQLKNLGFAFMPFHGGPRVCLGKDFALMEASYGLVRLLQAFPELRIAPGVLRITPGLEKQNLTIVVSSADGCKVLLR
ncbi:n-alkane-inducible cytochrome P450 [Aspergillus pseudoustus]|uniref:N-alkane-inducible cytochrome P450 n=1 Tax=Aspergillus pseudoustus TaxID=1810923 RepID=A0ABR4IVZ0_9EURO